MAHPIQLPALREAVCHSLHRLLLTKIDLGTVFTDSAGATARLTHAAVEDRVDGILRIFHQGRPLQ